MKKVIGKTRKAYTRAGSPVPQRPWFALTPSQKEQRLDTVAWHEGHDIFLHELLEHPVKRVCSSASSSNENTMKLLIRGYKQGIDLGAVPLAKLISTPVEGWPAFPRAPVSYESTPAAGKGAQRAAKPAAGPSAKPRGKVFAASSRGATHANLNRILDQIVLDNIGPKPRVVRDPKPPAWATAPEPMPWGDLQPEPQPIPAAVPDNENQPEEKQPLEFEPARGAGRPRNRAEAYQAASMRTPGQTQPQQDDNRSKARAAKKVAREALGIHEENDDPAAWQDKRDAEAEAAAREARRVETELIRSKLVINGRVRLDLEALSVYLMCPSYFAIATGLAPEPWQSTFLDCYAPRLGCLASRQCGKSIITARKAMNFALTNPTTTTLILAPTLRQSSELLLKIAGVASIAGLKISSLSQYQLVLADKQPGALSRVVCLPGSNEDAGASTRGYAADMLVLEEAAFLGESVISSVLPSIAARPKAQLIGISSAGIIGSFFHSVMTSPQSRWEKMIVPASVSGRFTKEQLDELRLNLGARYPVEMECRWGMVGDSIYTQDVLEAAFGTDFSDPSQLTPELYPDSAFGHLDLENIFGSQPFAQPGSSSRMH